MTDGPLTFGYPCSATTPSDFVVSKGLFSDLVAAKAGPRLSLFFSLVQPMYVDNTTKANMYVFDRERMDLTRQIIVRKWIEM
jgi:hypothetical protein